MDASCGAFVKSAGFALEIHFKLRFVPRFHEEYGFGAVDLERSYDAGSCADCRTMQSPLSSNFTRFEHLDPA